MKRIISISVIILIMIFTFASCGESSKNEDTTIYETLNKIFTKDNSLVNIKVETITNGKKLASVYIISEEANGKRITYSIERLNSFEEINGEYIIPDSYKTTLKGEAFASNGKIVEQSGDVADLDFTKIEIPSFKFNEGYFSNVQDNAGKFTADVTNPSGFTNASISCNEMSVSVAYSETTISEILLNYISAEGSNVIIKYSFD